MMEEIKRQQPNRKTTPIHVSPRPDVVHWMDYYKRRGYRTKAVAGASFLWTSAPLLLEAHSNYIQYRNLLEKRTEEQGISLDPTLSPGSDEFLAVQKIMRGELRVRTLDIRQHLLGFHNVWVLRDGEFSDYAPSVSMDELQWSRDTGLLETNFTIPHELRSLCMWAIE